MGTLSQVYSDNPLHLKHIIPLDFDSVNELPDSHSWPQTTNNIPYDEQDSSSIPIIDFMASNVVENIGHACESWGMFLLTNHGISFSFLDDVESHARRLFALPTNQKLKTLRSPGGATGYGAARISPFCPKLMWHEGFTIMGSPVEHAKLLWPEDYEKFSEVMEKYQKKMKALAYKILLLIMKSLGISSEEEIAKLLGITTSVHESSEGALQLNSYPCCPNPQNAMGLAPHTDSLLLTILHQSPNNSNGLQIYRNGIGWTPVKVPSPGALIVNIGDLLHILSNAQFPTVYHRAVVNQTKHRISVAYFYGPPANCCLTPFTGIIPVPRFQSLNVKEYIVLKSKHFEEALSLIRI